MWAHQYPLSPLYRILPRRNFTRKTPKDPTNSAQNPFFSNLLDQAVNINPLNGKALAYRGKANTALGRHERGFQDLNQDIRVSPQDADTHYLRGTAYLDLGQYQRALQDLDEAIRLDSPEPKQFVARGHTRVALGRLNQAAYDYAIAVQLRSDALANCPER